MQMRMLAMPSDPPLLPLPACLGDEWGQEIVEAPAEGIVYNETKVAAAAAADADAGAAAGAVAACEACGKRFASRWNLQRHLVRSPACKAWACAELVTMRAASEEAVAAAPLRGTDIEAILQPSGDDCPHCGRRFSSVSCLNRHFRSSVICDRWRALEVRRALSVPDAAAGPAAHAAKVAPSVLEGLVEFLLRSPEPDQSELIGVLDLAFDRLCDAGTPGAQRGHAASCILRGLDGFADAPAAAPCLPRRSVTVVASLELCYLVCGVDRDDAYSAISAKMRSKGWHATARDAESVDKTRAFLEECARRSRAYLERVREEQGASGHADADAGPAPCASSRAVPGAV